MVYRLIVFLVLGTATLSLFAQPEAYQYLPSDSLLRQAYRVLEEEKYEEGLSYLQQIPRQDTNYSTALADRIWVHIQLDNTEKAIALLEEGLQNPKENRLRYHLLQAELWNKAGDIAKAEQVLEKAVKIFPYEFSVYGQYADMYYEHEMFEKALKYYNKALKYNFLARSYHLKMGAIYFDNGYLTKGDLAFTFAQLVDPFTDGEFLSFYELALKNEHNVRKDPLEFDEEEDFSKINLLLRNQVALSDKYKMKGIFDEYGIARSLHLIFDQLEYDPDADNIWQNQYIPFFKRTFEEGHLDGLVGYLLIGFKDASAIRSLMRKAEKPMEEYEQFLKTLIPEVAYKRTLSIDGEKREVSLISDQSTLYAIGKMGKNNVKQGPWIYFHENSEIASQGIYNNDGKENGRWVYFTNEGDTSEVSPFDNGKRDGITYIYHPNGNLSQKVPYVDDMIEDTVIDWFYSGALYSTTPYQSDKKQGRQVYYNAVGIPILSIPYEADVATGEVYNYFQDGTLETVFNYKNDEKHGPSKEYYLDGQLYAEGHYENGKADGLFTFYYRNGNKSREIRYAEGFQVGEGKKYYPDGSIKEKYDLDERGKLKGESITYARNGKVLRKATYKDGVLQSYICFDSTGKVLREEKEKRGELPFYEYYADGTLQTKGQIIDGKNEGEWQYYSPYGFITSSYQYKQDALHGEAKEYYSNGQVSSLQHYQDGKLHGYYAEYNPEGKLVAQGWYHDDKLSGYFTRYYPNGKIQTKAYYLNGLIYGPEHTYDFDEKLLSIAHYDKGNLVSIEIPASSDRQAGTSRLTGDNAVFSQYYNNGQLKSEIQYQHGVRHGQIKAYNYFGRMVSQGQYLNTERHGPWTFYNFDGSVSQTRTYRIGRSIDTVMDYDEFGVLSDIIVYDSSGFAQGHQYFYYPDGKSIKIDIAYKDDEQHGWAKYYAPDGQLMVAYRYTDGQLVGFSYWDANKKLRPLTPLPNGSGQVKTTYPNGKTAIEVTYKNGEKTGVYAKYFPDGSPAFRGEIKDGWYHGSSKEYYPNGNLREDFTYQWGKMHGEQKMYYPNGQLYFSISYKDDRRHGPATYYHEDGSVMHQVVYSNDDIIKEIQ